MASLPERICDPILCVPDENNKVEQGKKKRLYNTKLMQWIAIIHVSSYFTYILFGSLARILFLFTVWCSHVAKKNWLIELGLEGICVVWKKEALSYRIMEYFGGGWGGKEGETHNIQRNFKRTKE